MAMSAAKVLAREYGLNVHDVTLAMSMTANEAAQFLGVSKKVGGVIAGSDALDLSVSFTAGDSGYTDGFVVTWRRADKPKDRTVTLDAGQSTTITGIPVGTSCYVVSVVPESEAPEGYVWGDTTFTPSDGEVKIVEGANAAIVVTATIEEDAEA